MTTKVSSLGHAVVDDHQYKAAVRAGKFDELAFHPQAALLTSDGLVPPDDSRSRGDLVRGPVPTAGLLDVISKEPTASDVVPYTYVDSVDNQAAEAAEDGQAAASEFTMARADALVQSIRTTVDLTRKSVQDPPRLRALLDGVLTRMLRARLERQLIQGNGIAPNLRGLLATPGIQSTAVGATNLDRVADALKKSADSGGGMPSGVLMSPAVYFAHFLDDDPHRPGPATVHKVPVILSDGAPADKVVVANFEQVVMFNRQAETVALSDSHADYYIRGLVAAVAEVRAALGVLFPASVVAVDLV
jgi:hypothetical protein